jgi:DNA-directed RNA polymerase subunit L
MMNLTALNPTVVYECTLPSTGKKIKFRPFFVKEERALLTAQESEDTTTMLHTLVSIIKNCTFDSGVRFTPYDIEHMFIHIRAKSVGEDSTLEFTCNECSMPSAISFDIRKIEMTEGLPSMIKVHDKLTIQMKHPSIDDVLEILDDKDPNMLRQRTIAACIDTIFSDAEAHSTKDDSIEDILGFLNTLTSKQYKLLEKYIEQIPTITMMVGWKCKHCKADNETELKGLYDFF